MLPVPMSATPGQHPGVAAERGLVDVRRVGRAVDEAGDGDVAVLVVQTGERAAQRGEGVADRSAEHAGVHGALQHRHLDDDVHQPAQAGREGGHVDGRVGRVGDDDDVAGQRVAVLPQERGERGRAGLLLALDEQRDAHRRAAVEGAQHGEVGHDARLVVGGAAGVEAPVPLGRLERRATSTARRRRSAGRRGGRRAARSARRAGRASGRGRRARRRPPSRPRRRPPRPPGPARRRPRRCGGCRPRARGRPRCWGCGRGVRGRRAPRAAAARRRRAGRPRSGRRAWSRAGRSRRPTLRGPRAAPTPRRCPTVAGNRVSPCRERGLAVVGTETRLGGRTGTVGCGHVPVPGDVAGVRIPVVATAWSPASPASPCGAPGPRSTSARWRWRRPCAPGTTAAPDSPPARRWGCSRASRSQIAPLAQAVWLCGGSVTMLHQPTARTDLAAWAEDTVSVLKMIDAALVVLGPPVRSARPGPHRTRHPVPHDRRARRRRRRRAPRRRRRRRGRHRAAAAHQRLDGRAEGRADHPRQPARQHHGHGAGGAARRRSRRAGVVAAALPRHGDGRLPHRADDARAGPGHGHPAGFPRQAHPVGRADLQVRRHRHGRAELRLRRARPRSSRATTASWTCRRCASR